MRYLDGMFSDITEKKRREENLRPAQKMEALGRLTGGVAHDFNNVLAVVLANSQFLIDDLAEGDPRRSDAEEIKAAGEFAASLTRQLLAFSRRQVLEPRVVDLNASVTGMEKMLRRLNGDDIALSVGLGSSLGSVPVDAGQTEQVIKNLVVNARDATPTGGKLSIQTAHVDFDDERAQGSRLSIPPGSYVMLAVEDTGSGMDAETQRQLFEPFFTTKELGKGTGLGLATCYGIVKQSGGYIAVRSQLGQGTVFRVYLPHVEGHPEHARERAATTNLDGSETVLLVEDDHRVRAVLSRMLNARGYQLLIARDGNEAMALAKSHEGRIDLVLSDVVMPGPSGPEIADLVRRRFAGAKALFMSGHTDHRALDGRDLQVEGHFIQKPFASESLARGLRKVLDAGQSTSEPKYSSRFV
jgi:nitrogen-specific signal transduction histidine kinase/CheY-like chemotaxis protein